MTSSYKRLGDYIQEVNIRNKDLKQYPLLGVSIKKEMMTSIANTVGTDMSTYKIIKKNQFAYGPVTSRNGDKISIALSNEEKALLSQAYVVFETNNLLLPEYLMMWFRRPEFDRYARYKSHGSAREIFDWQEMSEVMLPIPSLEKQQEMVNEYHTIQNRINLNNQLIAKLEETAQTIYKQWFVDFEFPTESHCEEKGTSDEAISVVGYKSSGGKMVWCVELEKEIPEGWRVGTLGQLCEMIDGDRGANYPKNEDFFENEYCLFLNAGNVTKRGFDFSKCVFIKKEKDQLLRKGKLQKNDIVLTSRGTVGNLAFYTDVIPYMNIRINSGMLIIRPRLEASYLFSMLNSFEFSKAIENYISGSAVPQLPIKDLNVIQILLPNDFVMNYFSNIGLTLYKKMDIIKIQNRKLEELKDLLLAKMTRVES